MSHATAQTQETPVTRPATVSTQVKWYDPVRRFGFLVPHDGKGDIWFNWLTLLKNKIPEGDVLPDTYVDFTFVQPVEVGKQRSVVFMRIVTR